jgi:subtilisin family serine protease
VAGIVRVGVADSGINPNHRQVGGVAGGVGLRFRNGVVEVDDAWDDELGHGTAAAATIRGHAPRAELYSIRIFRRRLETHVDTLLRAIDWASLDCPERLDILNLSLGCTEELRAPEFVAACERARDVGLVIVAASEVSGKASLPGRLRDVVAVRDDRELEGDVIRYDNGVFVASTWARELPGLPKERNVHGVSMAIAHVTGIAAALLANGVPKSNLVESLADTARGPARAG